MKGICWRNQFHLPANASNHCQTQASGTEYVQATGMVSKQGDIMGARTCVIDLHVQPPSPLWIPAPVCGPRPSLQQEQVRVHRLCRFSCARRMPPDQVQLCQGHDHCLQRTSHSRPSLASCSACVVTLEPIAAAQPPVLCMMHAMGCRQTACALCHLVRHVQQVLCGGCQLLHGGLHSTVHLQICQCCRGHQHRCAYRLDGLLTAHAAGESPLVEARQMKVSA
jgi:hypothetical protein